MSQKHQTWGDLVLACQSRIDLEICNESPRQVLIWEYKDGDDILLCKMMNSLSLPQWCRDEHKWNITINFNTHRISLSTWTTDNAHEYVKYYPPSGI